MPSYLDLLSKWPCNTSSAELTFHGTEPLPPSLAALQPPQISLSEAEMAAEDCAILWLWRGREKLNKQTNQKKTKPAKIHPKPTKTEENTVLKVRNLYNTFNSTLSK